MICCEEMVTQKIIELLVLFILFSLIDLLIGDGQSEDYRTSLCVES